MLQVSARQFHLQHAFAAFMFALPALVRSRINSPHHGRMRTTASNRHEMSLRYFAPRVIISRHLDISCRRARGGDRCIRINNHS